MCAFALAVAVEAQPYPAKVVRIVTAEVGGGGDFIARVVAGGFTNAVGQQFVVENRGGLLSIDTVAKAPPDGHTLLLIGSTLWIAPLLQKTNYDPYRDFFPITLTATSPNILGVHPSLPVNSVKDLVALSRARPGDLNDGSGAAATSTQLSAELFKSMAGVNIVQVPDRGNGPAMIGLTSGQVQVMFSNVNLTVPHLAAKRLKALAVTSLEPSAMAPGLPSVAATIAGYESIARWALFTPAATPAATISRLNQEAVKVLTRSDVKEKLLHSGVDAVGSSPETFAAGMHLEMTRPEKVIRQAGLRVE